MKNRSILFIAVLALAFSSTAQTLVFEEKGFLADTTLKRGDNTYTHSYLTLYGMGDYPATSFKTGGSLGFNFGLRHIREYSKRGAIGAAFSVDFASYRVIDESQGMFKLLNPRKENLELTNLNLEVFHRIGFGRSGKRIGNFLDLGLRGYRTVSANSYAEYDPGRYTPKAEVYARNVNFVYHWHYGLTARLGFNKFVVTGTMRLSESLKSNAPFLDDAELPRFNLGFQIGLHK